MKLRSLSMALVMAALLSGSAHATLVNFMFTIPGNASHTGPSGVISGELVGLTVGTTSIPTSIIITTDSLDGLISPLPYTISAANGWTMNYSGIGFTVNGAGTAITAANLAVNKGFYDTFYWNNSNINGQQSNNQVPSSNNFDNRSNTGFAGVTYTLSPAPVPEPSQWGAVAFLLVIGGLAVKRFSGRALAHA